ncbi:MAG TPA: toprim domain-containing protein [Terrimicrobiaceae bacterium]
MKISELADHVRGIPLCDVLQRYGFELKPEGTTARARSQSHNIVVTGSQWFDNKANVGGGGAIDLVMHIAGVDFSAACRALADQFRPLAAGQATLSFPSSSRCSALAEKKSFEELAAIFAVRADSNWPVARTYLVQKRKISAELVDELHASGSIYANDHRPNPSLVFLHRDPSGQVRGASLRDTRHQSAFRPCLGNKLTAWFAVGDLTNAERIVAVESPIDALSYHSLFANRNEGLVIVSCAGATVPHELMFLAYDRGKSVVVAFDNDAAGERGWSKARHDTVDWAGVRLSGECPKHKDWNDDLVHIVGNQPAITRSLRL